MKLYAYNHLKRIGLHTWAHQNLTWVPQSSPINERADAYFMPTKDFERMVQKYNVMAALKGQKICRPVYKNTWHNSRNNRIEWL